MMAEQSKLWKKFTSKPLSAKTLALSHKIPGPQTIEPWTAFQRTKVTHLPVHVLFPDNHILVCVEGRKSGYMELSMTCYDCS